MYDEDDEDDINLRISWKLGLGGIGNINDLSGWHPTRGFAKRNRGKKEETKETELPTFPKFDELNLNKPLHIVTETDNMINTYTSGLLKKEKAFQTVDTNATFTTIAKMVHHHLKHKKNAEIYKKAADLMKADPEIVCPKCCSLFRSITILLFHWPLCQGVVTAKSKKGYEGGGD